MRGDAQRQPEGDPSKVHRYMSLKTFIDLANDANECCNLLDLPNLQPDVPIFLRCVRATFE